MAASEPEWQQAITHLLGAGPKIDAFRTSGELAAVLLSSPKAIFHFQLALHGKSTTGGPVLPRSMGFQEELGSASDILGISTDGRVIVLDSSTGRILSDNIGGRHDVLSDYRFRSSVHHGCALKDDRFAFVDAERRGVVMVQTTTALMQSTELRIPMTWHGADSTLWKKARLAGAIERACFLWSADEATAFYLTDTGAIAINLHDENVDIASCPRGPAAVPKGRTHAFRVVRFYDASGRPAGVMRLNKPILRISCTRHRLIVLAGTEDSTFLSSFVLPSNLRDSAVVSGPQVIAPPPPGFVRK